MSEEKKYTAKDFFRYHSGEMPAEEMHALEKAALEDPFLADALEGYAYSENPASETEKIKSDLKELQSKIGNKPHSGFLSSIWWKIAAIFVLVAGAGYLFYLMNSGKKQSLAVNKTSPVTERATPVPFLRADSLNVKEDTISIASAENKAQTEREKPVTSPRILILEKSQSKVASKAFNREKEEPEKLSAAEKETVAQNEINNRELMKSRSNTDEIKLPENRYDTTMVVASGSGVRPATAQLSEVVANTKDKKDVSQAGYVAESSNVALKKLNGKMTGVNVSIPYPKGGMENFKRYIRDSAHTVIDSPENKLKGQITLSFKIGKVGNPVDIKVVNSDCKPCETEAIRLLQEGPVWIGKRGQSRFVEIQF